MDGGDDRPRVERLSSREVYRNAWMRVTEDAVALPDGTPGTYGVVHKDDFAVVVPWDGERLCVVSQYRYVAGGHYVELPQGSLPGAGQAVDPLTTAATELREETGLIASRLEILGVLHEAYGYATQRAHVVLATELTSGPPSPEATEVGLAHRWVTREEFWALQEDGTVTDAVSVAAMALFERWPAASA